MPDEPRSSTGPPRSIADGQVVGWFQGRMEWGARALGNRSILADPRRADMRDDHQHEDQVPREVPPVRADRCSKRRSSEYFDGAVPDPFMLQVYPVQARRSATVIPAVTHVDGSGRLQTVSRRDNPRYWQLIQRVRTPHRRADRAQHVVQRERADRAPPAQALDCFLRTRMDVLVLGNHVITKGSNGDASDHG